MFTIGWIVKFVLAKFVRRQKIGRRRMEDRRPEVIENPRERGGGAERRD